ncbi:synaptogenesis protein syg-2-like [Lineus longissimus]|uniref:synaptogenesis protein syg-2-like n=1 Tax=Lineus longissimus TaxID=88925 RepID=UPI00315C8EB4
MAVDVFVVSFILVSASIPLVQLIVPPKTPVLSGFEPVAIGSYRELVCDASQPDTATITYRWYKYSIVHGVENWESKGPIGTGQKYVFNLVTEKQVFHTGNPAEPVSGKYLCRASNSAGTRDSEWGDLYVYRQCSLYTVSVSPPKPAIGGTFTLNCHIPNPSGMSVYWLKKADASSTYSGVAGANKKLCFDTSNPRYSWSSCIPPSISSPTKTFNLQVTNAQPSDSGYWICQDISLSCNSNPVKPVVQAHPGTPQITGFPSEPVIAGTQLNLKCVALPPGDTYDWYKDGTKVTTSSGYDFQVTKESAGVYKCVARNDVGSAPSSDKTLVVYYKPDSVVVSSGKTSSYVGEKDKFTCTVSGGNPDPTVKLYFKRSGGTPVEVTQGQDRVMAKEDNQAEYYCEAKVTGYPAFDTTSSRKTCSVTFSNTKVSFLNNPTVAVQAGQVKKFTCETDESNPVTYIKWYKSTGSSWRDVTSGISSSERNGAYGGKIRISEWSVTATKSMNGATIRCASTYSLTGHVFTTNTDTTMYVKFNPSKITLPQIPPRVIYEGKLITIICETNSANPVANVTFHRKRTGGTWEQLTSGITSEDRAAEYNGRIRKSTLVVTANRLDTQTVFKCEVRDGSFQMEQTTTVNVYYPASVVLSLASTTVKEGDTVTLTCEARGGNPTAYTYKWYYNMTQIPNTTSRQYRISSIQYNRSGEYRCRVVNYSPGGIADASLKLDVLYKAKLDPNLPRLLTVESRPLRPVMFTLNVIANPRPTNVTWYHPNHKMATGENFIPAEVNGAYTLSKGSVATPDYGNYIAKVTNSVGMSYFAFELLREGPPRIPCCLKADNVSAVSVTLTFRSNFNGRSQQQFTIESKNGSTIDRYINIADPCFAKDVVRKIAGLKSNSMYEFRVKVDNEYGTSGYGDVLKVQTLAAPNVPTFKITRNGRLATVVFGPPIREYTSFQLKFCGPSQTPKTSGCGGVRFTIHDPTTSTYTVSVTHDTTIYVFYMDLYIGDDVVYSSGQVHPKQAVPAGSNPDGGMIAGVVVAVVILVAMVVVVVVVLHRRNMACFAGRNKPDESNHDDGKTGKTEADSVLHDPLYMKVVNRAFEGGDTPHEPVYVNSPQQNPVKDGGENPYDEMENPYADLNITPDVIASQTYAELKD